MWLDRVTYGVQSEEQTLDGEGDTPHCHTLGGGQSEVQEPHFNVFLVHSLHLG